VELRGINPYVRVSPDQATHLKPGWRRPMPVQVQVNGKPEPAWRINMMPAGDGGFLLYLHAQVRRASGTAVGDTVRMTLAFDEHYVGGPVDPMPPLLMAALRRNRIARSGWEALTPSLRKEILRYLGRLKSQQALQRNVQKALHVLAGGNARFLARPWSRAKPR
jgi:hypothetical protein